MALERNLRDRGTHRFFREGGERSQENSRRQGGEEASCESHGDLR
ncbi:Hypothetical protein AA314_02088 [Archangium gephyra]|uniref:Uncharacterized protein n=1 Tax=Archangium gephyra TaxID=48 RepID=A0AAC8TC67_9BACT|nr:Hypothetical protein AA314_02088 [Archangium gephyra]